MAKRKPAAPKAEPNQTPPATLAPTPAPSTPTDGAAPLADAQPGAPEPVVTPPTEPDAPGAEQAPQEDAVTAGKAEPLEPEHVPDLSDYIATHEKAAQAVELVVTAISHPDATPRHHPGVYSGFPIAVGPLQATYSDGSKH